MSKGNNNPKARRFYRSNLSTIVWDSVHDRPLADFSEGHFTTSNPKLARTLAEMGYLEIALNATEPPPNIIISQPSFAIDGDVPIIKTLAIAKGKVSETEEKMVESKMSKIIAETGGPMAPKVRSNAPVSTELNSSKQKEEVSKTVPSGKIPRRRK